LETVDMKNTVIALVFSASLILGDGSCVAADESNANDYSATSRAARLAKEAARTFSYVIKPSYKSIEEFIADYDSGKKQLESQLNKMGTPLGEQSQYRQGLINQIASYNKQITYMVDHSDFDARVQVRFQRLQSQLNAINRKSEQIEKSRFDELEWATAGLRRTHPDSIGRYATQEHREKARAEAAVQRKADWQAFGIAQMYSPEQIMDQAKQDVLASDNRQAEQLQAERNKLQEQLHSLDGGDEKIQDAILEIKADAESAYGDNVCTKVKGLTNTTSTLKESALAYVSREQLKAHAKLLDIRVRSQSQLLDRQGHAVQPSHGDYR
jgi:hypothetical protein